MKKISLFSLITFLTISITLSSCGGGGDGKAETIPPVAIIKTPTEKQHIILDGLVGTGKLDFSADIKAIEGLASYSVSVHINTPGHVEPKSTRGIPNKEPFVVKEQTVALPDTTNASIKHVYDINPIPVNGKPQLIQDGSYHLVLIVKDKVGKRTITIREFTIGYPKE